MQRNSGEDVDDQLSIEDTGIGRLRLTRGKSENGFDPYQGVVPTQRTSRKKDLRKLGEWLEAKRRAEALKHENEQGPAPADDPAAPKR
jgi:hypothetical protein